jgi:hypothetical protein
LGDHPKAKDHDCLLASDPDSLSAAGRDCRLARDVEVACLAALVRLQQAVAHPAVRAASVGREPEDAERANRPEYFDQRAAEAGHVEQGAQGEDLLALAFAEQQEPTVLRQRGQRAAALQAQAELLLELFSARPEQ